MRALNLGCGVDVRRSGGDVEWVNLDRFALDGVDVVWNLDATPWPLEDESFDLVLASDIWEHIVRWWEFMQECWRVLRAGGILQIRTCAFSETGLTDPDHKRWATRNTFGYWVRGHWLAEKYPHYASGRHFVERSARRVGDNWEFELVKTT